VSAPVHRHARVAGCADATRRAGTPGRGRGLASDRGPGRCRAGRTRSGPMSDRAEPARSATSPVTAPAAPAAPALPAVPAVPPPRAPPRPGGRPPRTGAPPPPPRRITVSTTAWLALAAILVTGAFVASEQAPWRSGVDQAGAWLLQRLAAVRTPWLTHVA